MVLFERNFQLNSWQTGQGVVMSVRQQSLPGRSQITHKSTPMNTSEEFEFTASHSNQTSVHYFILSSVQSFIPRTNIG